MKIDRPPSDTELFALYAQNDLSKWRKLKGAQVQHKTLGNGIITRIDRAFNNQIDIRAQFRDDNCWVRLDPFKKEFISNFTDLVLSNQLKAEILKSWKKTHQKWERTKKNMEKRQRREWEEKRKQRLERQKQLQLIKKQRELKKQRDLKLRRQEEQEKERRLLPLKPFIQVAKQVLSTQIRATVNSPNLSAQDIQLALKWYKGKSVILQQFSASGKFNQEVLIKNDDYELKRVLSARAAEKSVMKFYQSYGYHVEDVSIHEVTSESLDWWEYDLKINELSLDVKNSRRSKQSPDNYVEHCVPSFKQNRVKQEVAIAGILSPYFRASVILNPDSTQRANQDSLILFLGLTNLNKLTEIKNEFETPNLLEIDLQRPNRKGHFLPAWMFDYPEFLYEKRDNELSKIVKQTVPEYDLWKEFNLNPIPICTAAGIDIGQLWSSEVLANWEWSFLSAVLDRRKEHGLSLPYLFLGILKHFLQMVSVNEDISYRPTGYKRLVYDSNIDPDYNIPLGIYDPLKTIYNLITSLNTLWKAKHGLIRSFRAFKLQGLNILRGRRGQEEQWKTLIAYCGGWLPNGPKCGKNPLVLGNCEHCPECGKLICRDCQFCGKTCSEYDLRRHKLESSQ